MQLQASQFLSQPVKTAGFIEVLTSEISGQPFGYRVAGQDAGPQIVVAGICAGAASVFDRLLSIPTLGWIRGSLVLIRLDAVDEMHSELDMLQTFGPIDRTLVLPWSGSQEPEPRDIRASYHRVLRACADLGMIAGRGVPM